MKRPATPVAVLRLALGGWGWGRVTAGVRAVGVGFAGVGFWFGMFRLGFWGWVCAWVARGGDGWGLGFGFGIRVGVVGFA